MKTIFSITNIARRATATLALVSLTQFTPGSTSAAQADSISTSSPSASPSEMLQKGIYSEETKGDLDAAMELYRQVVKDAKDSQAVAAQAQYHLGVCAYKKKNYTEANAAFEKLIAEYPDQKSLVAMAQEYLSGAAALMPAPWDDGEELQLDVKFPNGLKIGAANYSVDAAMANGQKIWRLNSHLFAMVQQLSRVEVEADSFKPLSSVWKHTLIGEATTVYSPGQAEVKMKGKDDVKKVDLTGVIYDNEEAIQLFRRLPLATNYTTTIKVLSSLAGGSLVPFSVTVPAIEKVSVGAGTFDCYRVELSIKQTFWYSADEHRYLVKFEAGGVVAELARIVHRKPSDPIHYTEPVSGISVTAPPAWMIFRRAPESKKSNTTVFFLDPDALSMSALEIQSQDTLKPEQKKSLRGLADTAIADVTNSEQDVKVRADSWKDGTLAGQPSLSVTLDYVEGKENQTGSEIFAFVGTNALSFYTHAPAKEFDALQPQFEGIVSSCRTK